MTDSNGDTPSSPSSTERFATGFKRATGEIFVYGAFFLAALLTGWGLFFGMDGYFLGAIACILCALHFYPYLDTKNAQFGADGRGIYVGGLGVIDWNAIKDVALIRQAVRRVERAEVRITLNRSLEDALLQKEERPWWRQLQVKHWSHNKDGQVVVRLEQLKATPDEISTDFMPFWKER